RERAMQVVQYIPGRIDEMSPDTLALLGRFRSVLGLGPVTGDVMTDPLADGGAIAQDSAGEDQTTPTPDNGGRTTRKAS
ncbi:MAG: hypothetical protein Q4G49_11215, partial [Paracoccus sp. (in: a-proteobacteria)]|nr:hypothetical protein [Paracoccus sp. (in: a-proteobacteria)]